MEEHSAVVSGSATRQMERNATESVMVVVIQSKEVELFFCIPLRNSEIFCVIVETDIIALVLTRNRVIPSKGQPATSSVK